MGQGIGGCVLTATRLGACAPDDDIMLVFDATQKARHAAMLRANELARAVVERAMASAAGQQPDEDGVVPGPGQLRLVLGPHRQDKSTKQRGFLHAAVLPQIAEQYTFQDGTRYTAKVWKEYFRERFLGYRWETKRAIRWDAKTGKTVQAKRATPHRIRVSTEGLNIKQYSEYIDRVIDTAVAEFGVVFVFDESQREEVRYVKPVRRKPAKEG